MRFLVLGPLRIALGDGGEIAFTAAKHRALLAILLINSRHVVSLAQIVAELWEAPPPTATNLVRQYVSQVRRLLAAGRGRGPQLQTRPSGYALMIDRGGTDADEFERLVRSAWTQLESGHPERARQTVSEALLLWRGAAFADVSWGPSVAAERERMEELRVSARELGAKASLAAGQFTEAICELKAMTVHHPLREGLYANLMRALSLNGRKGDALGVYRTARKVLTTELGLEPGRELRELEQAILADALPAEPVPWAQELPVAARVPAPAPLPADLADFVGRVRQIAHLERILCGPVAAAPPVVVLSGIPGIGKTALAVRIAHRLRERFPDGQLFLRLRTADGVAAEPADLLGRAITLLGRDLPTQPRDLPARQDLYRSMLADRRLLLIMDDAVDEKQARWLLPGRSRSAALITSRSRLIALEGARHVAVPVFSVAEAVQLVALVAGPDRIDAEPESARAIGRLCGGLPVAIRVVAAQLAARPHRLLRQVAERLDSDEVFDELAAGDVAVGELVAATYRGLGQEERRVLARLTVAGAAVPPLLAEPDLPASRRVVDRLVEDGMLEIAGRDDDGRALFRCVELIRRYVGLQAGSRVLDPVMLVGDRRATQTA